VTDGDIHAIQERLDSQEKRLGERLDRQDEKLDRIVEAVTRQVAICGPTRSGSTPSAKRSTATARKG